ncbi:hypothetical protein [Streptomyces sp. Ru62]|nr:hypothetical protein [Streptomyces sp. Ru62]
MFLGLASKTNAGPARRLVWQGDVLDPGGRGLRELVSPSVKS